MSKTIIATRMELLASKKKIKLAVKGHKLLKEKRDALITEFLKIIDEVKSMRKELEKEISVAFKALIMAQAVDGINEVRRSAGTVSSTPEVKTKNKVIMGIKVPQFEWENNETNVSEKGYSMISSSLKLDESAKKFEKVLGLLVKVAEQEATISALAQEIKKTKRKVNALERILIPKLESEKTYITMRLEEMEREAFGRLKIIKAKIS